MNLRRIIYLFTSVSLLLLVVNAQLEASIDIINPKIMQGEKTEFTFNLHNTGIDRIGEINIYMNNTELSFSRNITIPSLFPNSKYTKVCSISALKSTTPKTYDITTTLYYEGKTMIITSKVEVLPFPLELTYKLDKSIVGIDEQDKLAIEVSNIGESDLRNVLVIINVPDLFELEDSNNISLDVMTPHETVSKSFFFTPKNGAVGDYHIISEVSFYDNETIHTDSDFITVSIGGGIGFLETVVLIIILVLLVSLFIRRIA